MTQRVLIFIGYLGTILLFVIGTTNYWLYRETVLRLNHAQDQAAENKLNGIAVLSGYYLSHFETQLLKELGKQVSNEPGVKFVAIRSQENNLAFIWGYHDTSASQLYRQAIQVNGKLLGEVELALDSAGLQRELNQTLRTSITLALVSMVLLGGLLTVFFRAQFRVGVERAQREKQVLAEEREFVTAVMNTSTSMVLVLDRNGDIVFLNRCCGEVVPALVGDVIGQPIADYLDILCDDQPIQDTLASAISEGYHAGLGRALKSKCISVTQRDDGRETVVEWSFNTLANENGALKYLIGTGVDVTLQYLEQRELSHMAYHDGLTALPNRMFFQESLLKAAQGYRRGQGRFALLLLDLERFQQINNAHGPEAGDFMLKETARRLTECLRDGDMVARLEGDEFAMILSGVDHAAQVGIVATKLINAISAPIDYHGLRLQIGASIGVAFFPDDTNDLDTLVKCADQAMHQAKGGGHNVYQLFGAEQAPTAEN